MSATISTPTTQPPELRDTEGLSAEGLSADMVRLTLDQLSQAVFLYRPAFDGGRIVDLEIIFCNRTALALPLNRDNRRVRG